MLENSKINKGAALRIANSPLGQPLLDIFLALEQSMEQSGSSDISGGYGFMEPGDPINAGDLIPTIHISMQPYNPILQQMIDVGEEES